MAKLQSIGDICGFAHQRALIKEEKFAKAYIFLRDHGREEFGKRYHTLPGWKFVEI